MLKIRLSMGGVRKRPVYKIVVADSRFREMEDLLKNSDLLILYYQRKKKKELKSGLIELNTG